MGKVNVQLLFTEDEYATLKVEADKYGLTVPLYIKAEVLNGDDFGTCYKKLLEKVENIPSGTKYNIRALFGVEWVMSRGVKLNLGKTYFNRVSAGIIDNVKAIGKDSSNIMWYEKI